MLSLYFDNIHLELLQIVNENIGKPQVVGKVQINGHPIRSEIKSEVKTGKMYPPI
jgi:hypothetical protein